MQNDHPIANPDRRRAKLTLVLLAETKSRREKCAVYDELRPCAGNWLSRPTLYTYLFRPRHITSTLTSSARRFASSDPAITISTVLDVSTSPPAPSLFWTRPSHVVRQVPTLSPHPPTATDGLMQAVEPGDDVNRSENVEMKLVVRRLFRFFRLFATDSCAVCRRANDPESSERGPLRFDGQRFRNVPHFLDFRFRAIFGPHGEHPIVWFSFVLFLLRRRLRVDVVENQERERFCSGQGGRRIRGGSRWRR